MKSNPINSHLKGRPFKGKPYLKLKSIRTEPRQRIRQLLRSFIPINQLQNREKPNSQIPHKRQGYTGH